MEKLILIVGIAAIIAGIMLVAKRWSNKSAQKAKEIRQEARKDTQQPLPEPPIGKNQGDARGENGAAPKRSGSKWKFWVAGFAIVSAIVGGWLIHKKNDWGFPLLVPLGLVILGAAMYVFAWIVGRVRDYKDRSVVVGILFFVLGIPVVKGVEHIWNQVGFILYKQDGFVRTLIPDEIYEDRVIEVIFSDSSQIVTVNIPHPFSKNPITVSGVSSDKLFRNSEFFPLSTVVATIIYSSPED